MRSIADERSGIETAILAAMYMTAKNKALKKSERQKSGDVREITDTSIYCPKKSEYPSDFFACDLSDPGRLFSSSLDDLVVDPVRAIGRGLELGLLCEDGTMKWTKLAPMPAPRGLVAITNMRPLWFSYHFREIKDGKSQDYIKKPFALAGGKVCLMKSLNMKGFDQKADHAETSEQLALMLSIFEDAMRKGAMLATVEEHVRMRFPIGQEAYKDFLRLRDGYTDTPTGRKNPILHWCSKHLRTRGDKVFEVSPHQRGAQSLVVGPMRLTIEESEGYERFI